jgi:methylenetetrahydrofolate reductase (NADPH)
VKTLEGIKDNDEAIRKFGIDSAVQLCKDLLNSGLVYGLHFYTLNREVAATDILRQLGLWLPDPSCHRDLPWKQTSFTSTQRQSEEVRPIFWSIRPKSYVCRTSDWDQFPNGRWGNSSAPSFGDLRDYHIFYSYKQNNKDQLNQWGNILENEEDIWNIFEAFISGNPNKDGYKITTFPWCEDDLAPETNLLKDKLVKLNRNGILTINSQPNVNGAPSNDPIIGWGSPDGYVYQKAYLEFFISADYLNYLLKALEKYQRVNYHIINKTVIF